MAQIEAQLNDVIAECTLFIACCYGEQESRDDTTFIKGMPEQYVPLEGYNIAPKLILHPHAIFL